MYDCRNSTDKRLILKRNYNARNITNYEQLELFSVNCNRFSRCGDYFVDMVMILQKIGSRLMHSKEAIDLYICTCCTLLLLSRDYASFSNVTVFAIYGQTMQCHLSSHPPSRCSFRFRKMSAHGLSHHPEFFATDKQSNFQVIYLITKLRIMKF